MTGIVVTHALPGSDDEHERATHSAIAQTLAAIRGWAFGGAYDADRRYDEPLYFVPSNTLEVHAARALGIRGPHDLFGGVVPHAFVATKAIVHPLVAPDAVAPPGWAPQFARRVQEVVLPGFTAFSARDARRAAGALLSRGTIRLKPAWGVGGHGQLCVDDGAGMEAALAALDPAQLAGCGLCIELDLADTTTFSVGQVRVGELQATYHGTQRTTTNNRGHVVFGGSDLFVARGGWDALAALLLPPEVATAVQQAKLFDAATAEFAGLFASRRNYDLVRGRDARGNWRSGILEQSWRIGGASGAEAAALAAFRADPALRGVHARCVETYGGASAPAGAIVHFCGVDRRVGALTKYTVVEAHETA